MGEPGRNKGKRLTSTTDNNYSGGHDENVKLEKVEMEERRGRRRGGRVRKEERGGIKRNLREESVQKPTGEKSLFGRGSLTARFTVRYCCPTDILWSPCRICSNYCNE